jgi:hypothetical protein
MEQHKKQNKKKKLLRKSVLNREKALLGLIHHFLFHPSKKNTGIYLLFPFSLSFFFFLETHKHWTTFSMDPVTNL